MRSRHVSQVVRRTPQEVYDFAAQPDNLPAWASGLAQGEVRHDGDQFVVEAPMGTVRVRFEPPNDYGILDHYVTLPSGVTVTNPMRVMTHPDGAEVLFTIRQLERSDAELADDETTVSADLERLRRLLES